MPGVTIYVGGIEYWGVWSPGGAYFVAFRADDAERKLVFVEADA